MRFIQGERAGACNPVDDDLHEAVCANVWCTVSAIQERSPAEAAAVRNKELLLKGAVYSLQAGEAGVLDEEG
jgi:carbonic anhydrase